MNKNQYLHLEYSSHTEETSEVDPDDDWSRASTQTYWDIKGISLSSKDGEYALPAGFPVEVGDEVHVLYVVYSTGDSFGHDDGAYLEVLSFHKKSEVAFKNLAAVESYMGSSELAIEFDNGEILKRQVSWDGYFESLDFARVGTYKVTAGS